MKPRQSTPGVEKLPPARSETPAAAQPGGAFPREVMRAIRDLLDELPSGVMVLDAEGRILFVNRGECELGARPEREIIGIDFFRDYAPQLESEGLGEHFRSAPSPEAAAFEANTLLLSSSGNRIVRFVLRALSWHGTRYGLLLIDDRTALASEQDRRQRAERLAAVGELAAGVAHEVNNPLASIKSFAQLLLRDAATAEQRAALEMIVQESTRTAGVVTNLLSFARRAGAGGREPVNLNTLAERVLSMHRYALDTAGIVVRRDFNASLSPVIGEAGALQQVILNLVVNAEQALATNTDGERLLIVRTRESTEGVILAVIDNGPGISKEVLGSIFESFRTTKAEGTGLGLSISATIVRDHTGHIWAESEEGRGTAFFVRLPRADQETQSSVAAASPSPQPTPQGEAPRPPSTQLRILVADDEPALRMAISLFLTRRGHSVTPAEDAYEALRLAQAQPFDVALVDARMPGDGLALLEKLEAIPALRGRTALMTGDIGRARTSQGITTGRPSLTKPFDLDDMASLLERLGR